MTNQRRDTVLEEAGKLINGDRRQQYGDDTFKAMAVMLSGYLGIKIEPYQAAEIMVLVKLSRNRHKPKLDSFVDGAGYLALAAEEAFGNDDEV